MTTIVAEISANHLGSLERAIKLIDAAADAGADAVKFQAYQAENMVADHEMTLTEGPWKGRKLIDLYREAETPYDWFPTLFEHARSRNITAFASVFDAGGLAMLERVGCPWYKIASFEVCDLPLIRIVAKTGKPMILSAGAATLTDVIAAVGVIESSGVKDIIVLDCVSAYPADPSQMNLKAADVLRRSVWPRVGLSDHTLGIGVSVAAVALGAEMIEKHLTLSRAVGGPDAGFSLEPEEFWMLCGACREAHAAVVGSGPPKREHWSLRRSLWTTAPIAEGEPFTEANVGSFRLAWGIPPAKLPTVLRSVATRDIPARAALQAEMVSKPIWSEQ